MKFLNILLILIFISSCKGSSGGGLASIFNSEPSTPAAQASAVETKKLVSAIQASPAYKIETSEIDLLKAEGVITDQDVVQLKAIQ
jgi:hypothetical protein